MAETPEERDRIEMGAINYFLDGLSEFWETDELAAGWPNAVVPPDAQLNFEDNKEGKYGWKLTWVRTGFEERSMQSDRALGTLEEAKEDARVRLHDRLLILHGILRPPASPL